MNKLNELLSKIISKLNISVKAEEQNFTEEQKAQIRENIGVGAAQIQADYTQNDSNASDYIKNRPFYTEKRLKTIEIDRSVEPKAVIKFADGNDWLIHASDEVMDITKEDLYGFSLNGEEKTPSGNNLDWSALSVTKSKLYNGIPCTIIGIAEQPTLIFAVILDKDITIREEIYPHGTYFLNVGAGTLDYFQVDWIKFYEEVVHKLDPKYYERLAWGETETIFEITQDMEEWEFGGHGLFQLEEAVEYIVEIDGTQYNATAKSAIIDNMTYIYIGNSYYMAGYGENTGEPFILGYIQAEDFIGGALFDSNNPGNLLSGEHTVRLIKNTLKKIEPQFLPDTAVTLSDMAENNPNAPGYIKNRPFYNGIEIDINKLIKSGAPTVTYSNGLAQYVKIADYFMPDDSILDTRVVAQGNSFSLRSDFLLRFYDNGKWEIGQRDWTPISTFVKSEFESNNDLIPSDNFEDGVYFMINMLGLTTADKIYLSIKKLLNSNNVSLSYHELRDIPFGDISEKVINFDADNIRDADSYIKKRKSYSDGSTEDVVYRRADTYIQPEIGATLILSDGSRFMFSESDIVILQYQKTTTTIQNMYAIGDLIIFNNGDSVPQDNFVISSDTVITINSLLPDGNSIGTYINLDTKDGVYVTGIVVENAYTKQLDAKFIPPELPAVTASDNGKFLRVSAEGKWVAQTILNAEEVAF